METEKKLITDVGLNSLNQPINTHLEELECRLETRIKEVNQRIASGKNEHLLIKKHKSHISWVLQYVTDPESTNHSFFDALKQIEIGSVLNYVDPIA